MRNEDKASKVWNGTRLDVASIEIWPVHIKSHGIHAYEMNWYFFAYFLYALNTFSRKKCHCI